MDAIAPLPVAVPLVMAALLAGLGGLIPRRLSFWIAIFTASANFVFSMMLLHASLAQTLVYWFGGWRPRNGVALGISFAIDPVGASLASLVSLLSICGMIFLSKYFDTVGTLFHTLMLAFTGAMCGLSLTGDAFNLFVFFELMSTTGYALCGYRTEDPAPVQGALNFAITNTIGAYLVLIGIGLLYARTGALNMAQIGRALDGAPADALVAAAFLLVCSGFLVKAAMVPFHFWLADAHAVAPTPVCALFSGVMVELGLYAVARVYYTMFAGIFASHTAALRLIFVAAGCLTALLGAGMCWSERNLKRLLAFSTISHMGLVLTGFAMLDPAAFTGAALYTLGHAGAKGGLFLAAGIVMHRAESVDEIQLQGRLRALRFAAAGLLCGSVALAGAPFSGIGAAAAWIDRGAGAGFGWLHWLIAACGASTAAAVLRFFLRTWFGMGFESDPGAPPIEERPETNAGHQFTSPVMWLPMMVLIVGSFAAGAIPRLQTATLDAALRFMDHAGYAAAVLDGSPLASHTVPAEPASKPFDGTLAVVVAIAIAYSYLRPKRRPKLKGPMAAAARAIRHAHSGHVGDYVAWLTFGVAALSAAAILALRS